MPGTGAYMGLVNELYVPSSISGRKPGPFLTLIYIIPLFLSETATRSRVVTPDSAIAVSLVLILEEKKGPEGTPFRPRRSRGAEHAIGMRRVGFKGYK